MKKAIKEDPIEAKFISPSQLGRRWNLSISAIYMFRGGTQHLTRHRFGRAIRFELAEIEKYENQILKVGSKGVKNNDK